VNEFVFFFNNVVVSGLVIGCIYALGAIGVTLIFGILRFAHFAHGDMMTLGAVVTYGLTALSAPLAIDTFWPVAVLVLPLAVPITAVLALVIDRLAYRPLRARGAKPVTLLIASIGVTLMLQGLIRLFYGVGTRSMFVTDSKEIFRIDMPFGLATRPIVISEPQVLLIVLTVLAVAALHLFLTRSRLGKGMRAMADNPALAQVSGINTQHVIRTTWLIAGSLACIAGTMLALDVSLKPDLAFNIVLPIFAAAIVGGLGQAYGAIAGGFLVGFAETLAVFNLERRPPPLRDRAAQRWSLPADLSAGPDRLQAHRRVRHPGGSAALPPDRDLQGAST
jgi:branched-chain amino acid transport system permease protein